MKKLLWMGSVALALGSYGCVASRQVHYYTLTSAPPSGQLPGPESPTVLVGHIAASQALQDSRIRYRAGSNEVGTYEYQRWTDPPSLLVRESLIHALRSTGRYRSVREADSSSDGDYLVRGRLTEFSELDRPGIQTRVSLDIEVSDRKTGKLLLTRFYTHDEPVTGKEVADVVRSIDLNLQQVLRDAVAGIDECVNGHSKSGKTSTNGQ
jgi:ABC-type uncharacterized transport system auxiliary subunit